MVHKPKEFYNCICCGAVIRRIGTPFTNANSDADGMWNGGSVTYMSVGYGSAHDGDMYTFGVCDTCIGDKTADKIMNYIGNYLP